MGKALNEPDMLSIYTYSRVTFTSGKLIHFLQIFHNDLQQIWYSLLCNSRCLLYRKVVVIRKSGSQPNKKQICRDTFAGTEERSWSRMCPSMSVLRIT